MEPKKSEIFTVKKINLPFSSIKVLEDQILINYCGNKVKIFNTQFKEISSFNTIKKVDKIIEIKKNFIAIFFYDKIMKLKKIMKFGKKLVYIIN